MHKDTNETLSPVAISAASQDWQREFRMRQVGMVVRLTPLLSLVNIVNASLPVSVLWERVPRLPLVIWLATAAVLAVYPLRAWWSSRQKPPRCSGSTRSVRRAVVLGGIAGLVWASAAPLFVSGLDHDTILFLSVVLSGMAAAGAVVLAPIPQAAIAYSLPICVAVVVVIVGTGDSILMMLGVMLVFFYYAVTTASRLVVLNATNALRDKYLEAKEREFYQGRFADFAKSSADLFWEMDASRRYTFVSSALSEDAGQQTSWALGRSHDEIVAEFHDRSEWEPFYRAFDARRPFRDLVARRIGDDGGAKWIRSSGVPVFGGDEIFQGYRGITSDVTSVMQVEQSLKESRHSLAEAQRTAHLGSWTLDVKTGEKTWSDEHFRIFGYEPNEITPTRHNFAAAVYPDDRERVSWHTEEVLIGKLPYDIEYRVVRLDGEIRNIHAQGVMERAADGTPLKIVGTVQDNTERVQAEELLRQAQKMEAIG